MTVPRPARQGAARRVAALDGRRASGPLLVAGLAAAVLAAVPGAALLAPGASADPAAAEAGPAPAATAGGAPAAAAPDPATPAPVAPAPRRLLVLDPRLLDGAVALGLRPLAAVTGSTAAGVPNYVDFAAGRAVAVVPADASADLLVGLRPDLVLGPAVAGPAPAAGGTSRDPAAPGDPVLDDLEVAYARLDAVAPVVRVPLTPGGPAADWRADLRALGDALGLRARAEEVVAGVDRRVAEVAAEVPAGERRSTAVLRVLADGVRVEPGPRVLAEVGLAAPAGLVPGDGAAGGAARAEGADGSPAVGPDPWQAAATAERLFLAVGTYADLADPVPQLDAALRTPAWGALPAAASGRTCLAAELPAWSVPGPLATRVVVDQVADCVASHARASHARPSHAGASPDASAPSAG